MEQTQTTFIELDKLRLDGGTQPRVEIDQATVDEYAEDMRGKTGCLEWPPIVVFRGANGDNWLADGFHRVMAAMAAGLGGFPVDLREGTLRDAILYSCGANATHGLRRSNDDKRAAVEKLLGDEEWVQQSDREIARQCAVSQPFVSKLRRELLSDNGYQIPTERTVQRGGTTYTMDTTEIGQREAEPSEEPDEQFGPPQERYADIEEIDSGIPGVPAWKVTPNEGAPLPEGTEVPLGEEGDLLEPDEDDTDAWMDSLAAGQEYEHVPASANPFRDALDQIIADIPRHKEKLAEVVRTGEAQDRTEAAYMLRQMQLVADVVVQRAQVLKDRPEAMAYLRDELNKASTVEDLNVISGEIPGLRVGSREADAIIDAFQQDVGAKRRKLQARQEAQEL